MMQSRWQALALGPESESPLWELFHENSKLDRIQSSAPDVELREYMAELHESLPFDGFPTIVLPKRLHPLKMPLDQAIQSLVSVREMIPHALRLDQLASLLHYSYGVSRNEKRSGLPRSLRVVPSAGALYPLEIFIHAANVQAISQGLYHYHPVRHHLRLLREGNLTDEIVRCFVSNTIPPHASLLIFITALFERSTLIYGDRGYRFALLEAGHVAQNINLVASSLRLGCLSIGGVFDRLIDTFLQLDGITHSTVSVLAIGAASRRRRSRSAL